MRVSSNSEMTNEQGKVFGAELKRLRKENGLTGVEFAGLVDCSAVHISQLESGRKKPSPQLAGRIADAFGLSVSDMLVHNDEQVCKFRKEYGATLKKHRVAKDLPPAVVAGALGIEPYIYLEYEQGVSSITEREMNTLNKLLDIGKKPEVVVETKVVEVPAEIPSEICGIILEHIRDLQIGEDSQKQIWRYFSRVKMDADERRVFGGK